MNGNAIWMKRMDMCQQNIVWQLNEVELSPSSTVVHERIYRPQHGVGVSQSLTTRERWSYAMEGSLEAGLPWQLSPRRTPPASE